jgi:hypothetical protein
MGGIEISRIFTAPLYRIVAHVVTSSAIDENRWLTYIKAQNVVTGLITCREAGLGNVIASYN